METIFSPMKKVKLVDNIKHQGIGGKFILIERVMNADEAPMNIAFANFVERRLKAGKVLPDIVYYGHVDHLGYFVGASEFDGKPVDATIEDYKEIW